MTGFNVRFDLVPQLILNLGLDGWEKTLFLLKCDALYSFDMARVEANRKDNGESQY